LIKGILEELLSSVQGARAVIFLDGEGEAIGQAGDYSGDMKLLGAWKEIHLDHIRDITRRLGLGDIKAVLFSLDEGTELIVPLGGDYCLLLFLSNFTNIQDALNGLKIAVDRLKKEIE
jgi:predicted regulator of Ras-like GTPase activity (Roadblock/LC7/MglB family)